ncbi:hypothetical protein K469DRAFT_730925 [Zopfia rhizophila CBS 207.26]|uniref:DUF6594 domain-containing protein n=1 Tax=Zopfia rhizophila CBS 207.26 TaxID=1314779 RepID=A0A6A6EMF5_9PEZI|nr:hypothetical protein K469DRAFT_730925 [Zopfia rhizophila CBS 207.26]
MGLFPETAIFRNFGALNARNLLYYQAELIYLENKLKKAEERDSHSEKGRITPSTDTTQLDLVMKIRSRLKEYNETLVHQSIIQRLEEPDRWDLKDIQHFLGSKDMGPVKFIGADARVWGSVCQPHSHAADIVTLRPREKADSFSRWVIESTVMALFRLNRLQCARFKKPSPIHGMIGFKDNFLYRVPFWIASIIASLVPIASIIVLYSVHSVPARLGVIVAFNLLMTVCMNALTDCKRAEVFAVAAA